MIKNGIFTISLDFELFWGVRDNRSIDKYGKNIENVHNVIPRLLELFSKYNIHCTWATVGFIYCKDKRELIGYLPEIKPTYFNKNFDQYDYIENSVLEEKYHFAPSIIKQILQTPYQEMATHTFSHYYALERGSSTQSFEADIEKAIILSEKKGNKLESIIFPRNQYSEEFLKSCLRHKIFIYRGTENSWLYRTRSKTDERIIRRFLRLADTYFNLTGHHTYAPSTCVEINGMWNIPSSRFLKPYKPELKLFDKLKLRRIKNAMHYAAKNDEIYHIWWHPHNFGAHMNENFTFLENILKYFKELQTQYDFKSLNLVEIKKKYE